MSEEPGPELSVAQSTDIDDARSAARRGRETAEEISVSAAELERMVRGLSGQADDDLAIIDHHLATVREAIGDHAARRAKAAIAAATADIAIIDAQVIRLRRAIWMLKGLMRERTATEAELATILRMMKQSESAVANGEIEDAASALEWAVAEMSQNESKLNPFMFNPFWMGVAARGASTKGKGVLIVRIENTGDRPIAPVRIAAPAPPGWTPNPSVADLPEIPASSFTEIAFEIKPDGRTQVQMEQAGGPLWSKVAVQTGYLVDRGFLRIDCRLENKTLERMENVLIQPWIPPGWDLPTVPRLRVLDAREVREVAFHPRMLVGDE